jgi:O-acetyl-ADP-ribose deacetylase (regulator of RNase III)
MSEADTAGGRGWSNPSVLAFAGEKDPLTAATDAARDLLDAARNSGMTAPPVDVVELAKRLGLELRPVNSITDAAVAAVDGGKPATALSGLLPSDERLALVYNPSRPRGRLRFSIAHEIAHVLFADVAQVTRHRAPTGALPDAGHDAWELELLCNVIAAELLLPDEAVAGLLDIDTDIDFVMETRARWDVSTEALLRRLVSSTSRGLTLVAASHRGGPSSLAVEYAVGPAADLTPHGSRLPSIVAKTAPLAVGQTSRAAAELAGRQFTIQAVGSPPYPGQSLPRVLALLEPATTETASDQRLTFITSDITDVDGATGPVVIAHVVSDSARAWSRRGVAAALAQTWPRAATAFRAWSIAAPRNLALGHVHHVDLAGAAGHQVTIASMVVQQGYGPGSTTRLQYDALATALGAVADIADRDGATVHMPRIGAGQAGGRWDLIETAIVNQLVDRGVPVTVHTLPARPRGGHG